MIKQLASGAAALALTLTLGAGAATAAQDDPRPVAGTQVCVDLVNGQSSVVAARENVQTATANLNAALRANPINDALVAQRRQELADAQATLRRTVANVTDSLCKDAPAPAPKPTTTTTEAPAPTVVTDDLDCPDFRNLDAAQAHLDADRSDPDRLDRDNDGVACEQFFGEPVAAPRETTVVVPGGAVVDNHTTVTSVVPTADDDSTANVSGAQVAEVPEGSVSTGAA